MTCFSSTFVNCPANLYLAGEQQVKIRWSGRSNRIRTQQVTYNLDLLNVHHLATTSQQVTYHYYYQQVISPTTQIRSMCIMLPLLHVYGANRCPQEISPFHQIFFSLQANTLPGFSELFDWVSPDLCCQCHNHQIQNKRLSWFPSHVGTLPQELGRAQSNPFHCLLRPLRLCVRVFYRVFFAFVPCPIHLNMAIGVFHG